ncbi:MAG: Holliday junction resolvase RuvX [Candidatus Zambryskibacteria bacterium]|nr:Holliday junction resolvase RuvX [Candidatus Zambryskibacteria bacterium]
MRLMGIDYGIKRVGIALSDEGVQFAMPFSVIENSKKLINEIIELAQKNKVEEVILGESKDYDGKDNAIHAESLEFKKLLEEKGLKVYLEPEFMTSVEAERKPGRENREADRKVRKEATVMLDARAAALILQSYIDKNINK